MHGEQSSVEKVVHGPDASQRPAQMSGLALADFVESPQKGCPINMTSNPAQRKPRDEEMPSPQRWTTKSAGPACSGSCASPDTSGRAVVHEKEIGNTPCQGSYASSLTRTDVIQERQVWHKHDEMPLRGGLVKGSAHPLNGLAQHP